MKKNTLFCFLLLWLTVVSFSQEQKISKIIIQGANKTKHSFIKKNINTKEGIVLDSITLEKDVVLLRRQPAFSHAYYQVFKEKDNTYSVKIGVEENFTLIPDINIWTTTNNVFSYKLGLYDYNFLGRNMVFGGFYQYNGFDTYAINFRAPNLFSKKWGLALNHQNWKSEEPLFFNNQSANYLYNNISYEALALYQINLKHEIDFGINIFSEKYRYLSGATDPTIPQNLDLDKTLFKFVYLYNGLDYYYQYVSGFKSKLYLQYVTSTSTYQSDFFITWNDFFYYKRLGNKGNWANRLRLGLASNEDSPFAPFALDNNLNLRGVGILVDRGTGVVVLNTEYRHTVYDKKWFAVQTNVFTDIGSWRNPGGELNDILKGENVRAFAGFGLRFISKKVYNATFRIDYGVSLVNKFNGSRGGLVFGVGQYF